MHIGRDHNHFVQLVSIAVGEQRLGFIHGVLHSWGWAELNDLRLWNS